MGKARVPLLLLAALSVLLSGCLPSRTLLKDSEAAQARLFFARIAEEAVFPVTASFSGVARPEGRGPMPFLAGVNAASPGSEKLGLYEPMGGAVAFISNDGSLISVIRGPMADLAGLDRDIRIAAESVSLGRILSGAPGHEVSGGEVALGDNGGWIFTDGRQTLFSDPGRGFLAKAEYRLGGVKATVEYPDRSLAPPRVISIAVRGMNVSLQRDQ
ncbi:MAG: hypothetical protein FWF95_00540 [Syntrophorhabdaceae bacterium]|nr:hypothetical protein [Syntrophorhabdaceae bacterium]